MSFDTLATTIPNPTDALHRLAYARGFLVEWRGDDIVMNDDPERSRARIADWNDLLYLMGDMVNTDDTRNRIVGCTDSFSVEAACSRLFEQKTCERSEYGQDASLRFYKATGFAMNTDPLTMELDPYVAMYIKALSAVGIITNCSCDGHGYHDDTYGYRDKNATLLFETMEAAHTAFHAALWATDEGLKRFDLPWEYYGDVRVQIEYDPQTMQRILYDVICAGQYIYENRVRLRALHE